MSQDQEQLLQVCQTPDELHRWAEVFAGMSIPRQAVCPHHQSPFEYLRRAYFEPAADLVVWAPRGGGKTRLAALATFLDLIHKPQCAVRILGGSLDQSLRMWEHLLPPIQEHAADLIAKRGHNARRILLRNGSSAAVLTQSQRAVRGLRVQKLRCDEVELFHPDVWEAAQLITRSTDGGAVAGVVEALSTLHNPWGLMHRVVEQAQQRKITIVRWCLLEVLERCPAQRDCAACALAEDCQGVAKTRCAGFVRIDDAIAMKRRVSRQTWAAEMLCQRPSQRGAVFPGFDVDVHVKSELSPAPTEPPEISLAIDFGFANPFVCLWIATCADGRVWVLDEYVQEQRTVEEHLEHIASRPWKSSGTITRVACDPAGGGRNEQTAESNIALLRRHGYRVDRRRSLIVEGLEQIRHALRPALGEPKLFVHPRCARLIRALQAYHYGDNGSELPLKDGVHDHPIDALRYHFVNRPRMVEVKCRSY